MNIIIKKYTDENLFEWDNFVLNDSLNGTIYHTQNFLSYHKNKFKDESIMIYEKENLIAVFPCCKVNNEYFSHRGSTCGGLVYLNKYNELNKLTNLIDKIYNYYDNTLHIKLSENIYFKNNNNELINFILSQKCKSEQDISLYFNIRKYDNIIDGFPKNDNKRLLKKYINNKNTFSNDISIRVSDDIEDYKIFYNLLTKYLETKNGVKPLHTLEEFIKLKDILKDKQFLLVAKNSKNQILSGTLIFLINNNTYYTVYLMTNYEEKYSQIFYILYELFEYAKKNNIKFVNLGACSTQGGKEILYNHYKFKSSCGCEPVSKYSFTYFKDKHFNTNKLYIKEMNIKEQYLICHLWQINKYARDMFFFKDNELNYENQINWFNMNNNNPNIINFSIFNKSNNNFIGYCGIKNITPIDCELFIVILDSTYYGMGLGKEAFYNLLIYTIKNFPELKIYLNVKKDNYKAIKLYKILNFDINYEDKNTFNMILNINKYK